MHAALTMPLRTNRLATLMVVAGIVGSLVTLFKYTLSPGEPALPAAQAQPAAQKEQDLCRLAAKLSDAADPSIRASGEGLRKANGCKAG